MEEGVFKILAGRPTGKRPLGRPNRRWEVNITTNLKGIGINMRSLIHWAQEIMGESL